MRSYSRLHMHLKCVPLSSPFSYLLYYAEAVPSSFKKIFIYLFLEREREGEREGEKHQCVVASHVPQTGHLDGNPGVCIDWESKL